jgi:hypothetical protein
MTTRVDPELYSDSPIFRAMLRERKGRWPGIPLEELTSGFSQTLTVTPLGDAPLVPPVVSRVRPLVPYDPEETRPMPLPSFSQGA